VRLEAVFEVFSGVVSVFDDVFKGGAVEALRLLD
jgi:hypothetical protein